MSINWMGPFSGMTLSAHSLAEHIGPYLLGACEAELHEAFVPGVTERCRATFASTHGGHIVDMRSDMPLRVRPASFTEEDMRRVSSEARGPQQWLVLTPLTSSEPSR